MLTTVPVWGAEFRGNMMALGAYTRTGDAAEHAAEAKRLGAKVYRMQMANALLGAAPSGGALCEQLGVTNDKCAARRQQLLSEGDGPRLGGSEPGEAGRVIALAGVACDPPTE